MNSFFRLLTLMVASACFTFESKAQCNPQAPINFINPSFEGTPQAHVTPGPWSVCMPGTTPDTQPGSWGINLPATNGSTYLGLVHDPASGWQEGASEQLSAPFIAGTAYSFNIDLANSSSTGGGIQPGCAELQIWGGFGPCAATSLLWSSGNITPYDTWITRTVSFTPTQNFTWVMLRINSLGCSPQPYILVDNISAIQVQPLALVPTVVNASCFGFSTGSAYMGYTGGAQPVTFNWSNGVTTQNNPNLFAGTYGVTVSESNGCSTTGSITITQPPQVVVSLSPTHPSCANSNGSITASTSSGNGPFSFAWSNGQSGTTISGLASGNYSVTATGAGGCTGTASVSLNSTGGLTLSTSSNVAACSQNIGTATVNVLSGNGPFTYAWSNGGSTATINNLAGGTYSVTVNSADGCSATASATVQSSTGLIVSVNQVDTRCNENNGEAEVTVTAGIGPYTYVWNTGDTLSSISGLSPGSYNVTVTGNNGCSASAGTSVASSIDLTITSSSTPTTCNGANGSAEVSIITGNSPYSYLWSNGITTAANNNIVSGTYTVTVTDASNCTASTTLNVAPSNGVLVSTSSTPTTCGLNNGSATVTVTAGSGPFDYLWSNGATIASINNVASGTYTVTITGADACSVTASVNVAASSAVTLSTTENTTTCGLANGSGSVNVLTGAGPFDYLWNNGATASSISSLSAGNYHVTVIGAGGCSASASINVGASSAVTLSTTENTTTCGLANGSGGVNVLTGAGPFDYLWNNGATASSISSLSAGGYIVTVTGAGGCSASASINVGASSAVTLSATENTTTCGLVNGSASVSVLTGAGPFDYLWSNGTNTADNNSLAPGLYTVTVTGAGGCSASASVSVDASVAVSIGTQAVPTTCGLDNGSASVTVTAGVGPFDYLWSNGATTADISDVASGTYEVTVTGAGGCTASASAVVDPSVMVVIAATPINAECGVNTGSASVDVQSASHPVTYLWNTGDTTIALNNIGTGTYSVTVTDDNRCTATQTIHVVVADTIPPVAVCLDITVVLSGGTASITADDVDGGCTDNCGIVSKTVTPDTFDCSHIGDNTVTLTVADSSGNSSSCQATVTVTGRPLFSCSITSVLEPSMQLTGGGANTIYLGYGPQRTTLTSTINGQGQFTYAWTPATGLSCTNCPSPVFTPTAQGLYTFELTITNESGCSSTCSITICVLDIRADADCGGASGTTSTSTRGNSPGKVYVCHLPPGNPANWQLICIGVAGVPAHVPLHGGDHLGRCNQTCGSLKTDEENVPELFTDLHGSGIDLLIFPNPFSNQFRVHVESERTEPVDLRLFSVTGQLVSSQINAEPNTDVYLGANIANGTYFLEATQDGFRKVIRVIKAQ